MFKSHFPFILNEGVFTRSFDSLQMKCIIPEKTHYEPSRILALSDAHSAENFVCAILGCDKPANRTIVVLCKWDDDIEEAFEEFDEFLPDEIPLDSNAIIPVCQSCEIEQRKEKEIEIQETECILHHDDFENDIYTYFIHCDEKLIIDASNPEESTCNVCGFSVSQLDYEDEPHIVDDDRTAFSNWGDY